MKLSLEIIESKEGIKRFLSNWEAFEDSQKSHFYQRGFYFLSYFEHLTPSSVSPHLMVFSDQEKIVGIFPWVKQKQSQFGIPFYRIGSIKHDHVNLSDVIYDKSYVTSIAELFETFLKTLPFNSVIAMHDLKAESQFFELLSHVQLKTFKTELGSSFYIDFNEEVDSHLPKRMVKNVKRLLRKANDSGSVEFKFLSGEELTIQAFEDFLAVESSGWKGQSGTETAIRLDPQLKAYYQSFLEVIPSKMQLSLFYLNGDPIAAHYCFKDNACISLAKVGYMEEHRALSPSHVLIYQAINNASLSEGNNRISFVTGASWLGQWYPKSSQLFNVQISTSIASFVVLTGIGWVKSLKKRIKASRSSS